MQREAAMRQVRHAMVGAGAVKGATKMVQGGEGARRGGEPAKLPALNLARWRHS